MSRTEWLEAVFAAVIGAMLGIALGRHFGWYDWRVLLAGSAGGLGGFIAYRPWEIIPALGRTASTIGREFWKTGQNFPESLRPIATRLRQFLELGVRVVLLVAYFVGIFCCFWILIYTTGLYITPAYPSYIFICWVLGMFTLLIVFVFYDFEEDRRGGRRLLPALTILTWPARLLARPWILLDEPPLADFLPWRSSKDGKVLNGRRLWVGVLGTGGIILTLYLVAFVPVAMLLAELLAILHGTLLQLATRSRLAATTGGMLGALAGMVLDPADPLMSFGLGAAVGAITVSAAAAAYRLWLVPTLAPNHV